MNNISPVFRMELIEKVEKTIWDKFKTYKKVEQYISMNQEVYNNFGDVDFSIIYNESQKIDLITTLGNIASEVPDKLIVMAIDLGIETPDFIPCIPTFRNKLKSDYENASASFEKAFQNIEKDPQESVGNANSILESIIKEILLDDRFSHIDSNNTSSKKLVGDIIRVFELSPGNPEIPKELKTIGASLTSVAKAIEDLRSDKTLHHGQSSDKYLIDEPLYAYFVVNACATVGLFLIDFYENKFLKQSSQEFYVDDDLPF